MIKAVAPQADFLRRNAKLFNDAPLRAPYLAALGWCESDP